MYKKIKSLLNSLTDKKIHVFNQSNSFMITEEHSSKDVGDSLRFLTIVVLLVVFLDGLVKLRSDKLNNLFKCKNARLLGQTVKRTEKIRSFGLYIYI